MRPSVVKPRYSTFVHGSCSLGVVVASAQTSDGPHSAQQRHPLRISQSSAPLSNFRTVADLAGIRSGGPDTAGPRGVAQPDSASERGSEGRRFNRCYPGRSVPA